VRDNCAAVGPSLLASDLPEVLGEVTAGLRPGDGVIDDATRKRYAAPINHAHVDGRRLGMLGRENELGKETHDEHRLCRTRG
jgi:hypothetical protein